MQKYFFRLNQHELSVSHKSSFMKALVRAGRTIQRVESALERSKNDLFEVSLRSDTEDVPAGRFFFRRLATERSVCRWKSGWLKDLTETLSWGLFAALVGGIFIGFSCQLMPAAQKMLPAPNSNKVQFHIDTSNNDNIPLDFPPP